VFWEAENCGWKDMCSQELDHTTLILERDSGRGQEGGKTNVMTRFLQGNFNLNFIKYQLEKMKTSVKNLYSSYDHKLKKGSSKVMLKECGKAAVNLYSFQAVICI